MNRIKQVIPSLVFLAITSLFIINPNVKAQVVSQNTTASSVVAFDGSQTNPSMTFASDPDTGFYSGGANIIDMTTAGSAKVRLNVATDLKIVGSMCFTFAPSSNLNTAADLLFCRVGPGQYSMGSLVFANLGTPANGTFAFCSDCTIANPCAGAGTGSFAKRLNGVWVCN